MTIIILILVFLLYAIYNFSKIPSYLTAHNIRRSEMKTWKSAIKASLIGLLGLVSINSMAQTNWPTAPSQLLRLGR